MVLVFGRAGWEHPPVLEWEPLSPGRRGGDAVDVEPRLPAFSEGGDRQLGADDVDIEHGLALIMISSPVKGLMPLRALVAGFLTTTNLAKPGSMNSPVFFIS